VGFLLNNVILSLNSKNITFFIIIVAKKEEKKEESDNESDDDMGFGLFN